MFICLVFLGWAKTGADCLALGSVSGADPVGNPWVGLIIPQLKVKIYHFYGDIALFYQDTCWFV